MPILILTQIHQLISFWNTVQELEHALACRETFEEFKTKKHDKMNINI